MSTKPNTARIKFAAQDRILAAIEEDAKKIQGTDPAGAAAVRAIGAKLAERWGVRNYPGSAGQ